MNPALAKRAWQIIGHLPADDQDLVRAMINDLATEAMLSERKRFEGPPFGKLSLVVMACSALLLSAGWVVQPLLYDLKLKNAAACCERQLASEARLELFERACDTPSRDDLRWSKP